MADFNRSRWKIDQHIILKRKLLNREVQFGRKASMLLCVDFVHNVDSRKRLVTLGNEIAALAIVFFC